MDGWLARPLYTLPSRWKWVNSDREGSHSVGDGTAIANGEAHRLHLLSPHQVSQPSSTIISKGPRPTETCKIRANQAHSKTPKERALERGSHVLPWVGDPFTQYDDYLDQDENKPRRFRKNNGGSGSHGGDEDGYIKTAPIRAVTIQQHEREVALEIKIQDLEKQRAVLPVQLLYDLFFVANLSAITSDKQFYNPESQFFVATPTLWRSA